MIQEFLRGVPLFRDLDDDDLAQLLMAGRVRRFAEGAQVLTEGAPGGQLHVIHTGKIRISKIVPGVGEEALAILEPGHAIAHVESEILSIPHEEMRELISSRPELSARFLWAFGGTLARRLRETNQKMATLFAISRTF
jgi:CRP-like cAMP-binding protein